MGGAAAAAEGEEGSVGAALRPRDAYIRCVEGGEAEAGEMGEVGEEVVARRLSVRPSLVSLIRVLCFTTP